MSEFVIAFLTFANRARLRTALYGGSQRVGNKVVVTRLNGEVATVVTFDNVEETDLELLSINEQVDRWETTKAARNGRRPSRVAQVEFVSEFLTFSTHARLHMSRYGSSNRSGSKVIIVGLDDELSMVVVLDNDEDAESELGSINEQTDRWEAAKERLPATGRYISSGPLNPGSYRGRTVNGTADLQRRYPSRGSGNPLFWCEGKVTTEKIAGAESSATAEDSATSVVNGEIGSPVVRHSGAAECPVVDGGGIPGTDTYVVSPAIYNAVFVGFDTEWCADRKRKLRNIVLAYAMFVLCGGKVSKLVIEPKGPERRHRLSLKRLIGLAIQTAIQRDVLDGWPAEVYLAMHYGRGDLAACSDFKLLRPQLASVRGTLATQSRPIDLGVEIDGKSGPPVDILPFVPGALSFNALDCSGNSRPLRVRVLDTYCLAPEGASLDALGKLLGFPKLPLPPGYDPADMARFREEQPALFKAYHVRDAEITARYAQRYARFCASLGLRRPPGTLGAAAVAILLAELKEMGQDRPDLFGLKIVKTVGYSRAAQRRRTSRQEELTFANKLIDLAASDAYSGGRTETFMTGPIAASELRLTTGRKPS